MNLLDQKKKALYRRGIGIMAICLALLLNILKEFFGLPQITTANIVVATASSAVYLISSYLVYFIQKSTGEEAAKSEERYEETNKKHGELLDEVIDRMNLLPDFCAEYSSCELKSARMAYLRCAGIDYDTYTDKYLGRKLPKDMPRYQKVAIRHADRVKPLKVSKEILLAREDVWNDRRNVQNPTSVRRASNAKAFSQITVRAIFAANIVFSATVTSDFKTAVLNALLQTAVLLWLAYSGYKDGYRFTRDLSTSYTEWKCEVLNEFKRWNPPEKTAE